MKSTRPALIFDLGKVLIDWDPRHLYRKLFDDEAAMEHFLAEICSPDWNEQQDGGRSFAAALELLIPQYPEHEALIRAFWERWHEMLNGPIEGTLEIMRAAKANGYRIFALSNWSAETYPRAVERYDFLQEFEYAAISGQLGMMKPQPEIFHHILEKIGQPAHECIFIDDSLRNITAAQTLGIDAIHFTTPATLQQDLVQRGIVLSLD